MPISKGEVTMPSEQKIIVIPDGKICDYIDGKFRNDTPEEYVRQTIEKRLVNEHKYLPEQIRIEYTLQVGSNKPRADIVIWEKGADQTQGTIKLIIECKKETVEQFELAHIWDCDKETGVWKKTSRLQSSVPPEILFIERCTQFLAPGGRMGIVLPDSILGSPGLGYIREWMIQNHRIVASIDLNADTFQPRNGTQTSVLILQKKTQEQRDAEEKSGKMADYNIFMAMVEKVGHDKRGNPLFKRDKEGNEILVPDTNSVLVLGETGDGQRTVSHEQKVKVEDDQTPDVPAIFAEWKKQEGLGW